MNSRGIHLRNRCVLAYPLRGTRGKAVRVPVVPEPPCAPAYFPAQARQEPGQAPCVWELPLFILFILNILGESVDVVVTQA